jgi:hypothetical protein
MAKIKRRYQKRQKIAEQLNGHGKPLSRKLRRLSVKTALRLSDIEIYVWAVEIYHLAKIACIRLPTWWTWRQSCKLVREFVIRRDCFKKD